MFLKTKKTWLAMLVLLLIASLTITGCGGSGSESSGSESNEGASSDNSSQAEKPMKVAAILSGEISDMGWNSFAYKGLVNAEKKFGVEIAYSEKVSDSDAEEFFRGYAQDGFDLVIGHGFEFGKPAENVAKDFPDTQFVITSINLVKEPNLGSTTTDNPQQGFVAGTVAALLSKSGKIGYVGGREIPPVIEKQKNSELGAKYVREDVEYSSVILGTYDDMQKAKESTYSMIEQGADVIIANADKATLAILEACKEKGVYAIGMGGDEYTKLFPDNVPIDVVNDVAICVENAVEKLVNGQLKAEFSRIGVKEGAVRLTEWNDFVPAEVKDGVAAAVEDLQAGKIELIRVDQ